MKKHKIQNRSQKNSQSCVPLSLTTRYLERILYRFFLEEAVDSKLKTGTVLRQKSEMTSTSKQCGESMTGWS
jgi:hypothetical protein